MADKLKLLREGIADALRVVPDVQVSPRWLSNPQTPAVHVYPGEIDYHRAMQNGSVDWLLIVEGFVALVTDEGAQEVLDRMIEDEGAYSVKAAIEADPTLGGVCDHLTVTRTYDYGPRLMPDNVNVVLACKWDVEVMG